MVCVWEGAGGRRGDIAEDLPIHVRATQVGCCPVNNSVSSRTGCDALTCRVA